ncbi:pyridoxamine 5'-phosphate oxidase family protein [Nakamurella lactea]|uniref:pyridoxamine 5'-phosphate oxidase family protein n=1 Tax=Nakamurella lactea TaxID=459515 RepID=UPI00040FBDA5|nr:pyridoxamine 5'-phosphate oxidase family protein [Nakamurella lactea]
MNTNQVAEALDRAISQELLGSDIPARLAYQGLDEEPRVIPIAFLRTGRTIEMFTVPRAAKVAALQANPRVAITIDTQGYPPRVLLIRGVAALEQVDGVPDGYVRATSKLVPAGQMADWEAGVRALYRQMVVITVTPDWVKLLDFETTIPKAVAELVAAHGDPR